MLVKYCTCDLLQRSPLPHRPGRSWRTILHGDGGSYHWSLDSLLPLRCCQHVQFYHAGCYNPHSSPTSPTYTNSQGLINLYRLQLRVFSRHGWISGGGVPQNKNTKCFHHHFIKKNILKTVTIIYNSIMAIILQIHCWNL